MFARNITMCTLIAVLLLCAIIEARKINRGTVTRKENKALTPIKYKSYIDGIIFPDDGKVQRTTANTDSLADRFGIGSYSDGIIFPDDGKVQRTTAMPDSLADRFGIGIRGINCAAGEVRRGPVCG